MYEKKMIMIKVLVLVFFFFLFFKEVTVASSTFP